MKNVASVTKSSHHRACFLLLEIETSLSFSCLSRMPGLVQNPRDGNVHPSKLVLSFNYCSSSLARFLLFCLEMATHHIRVVTILFICKFKKLRPHECGTLIHLFRGAPTFDCRLHCLLSGCPFSSYFCLFICKMGLISNLYS